MLIVCNVGPHAAPLKKKFRETSLEDLVIMAVAAKCPHQGGCLNEGELKDIEDVTRTSRAIIRCPLHNMQFDAVSGEGVSNHFALPCYPTRVVNGALHIGIAQAQGSDSSDTVQVPSCSATAVSAACQGITNMDVDMEGGGSSEVAVGQTEQHPAAAGAELQPGSADRARSRSIRPSRQLRAKYNSIM